MAFDNKTLSVLAYSNGFTLWHYRTSDDISELMENEYFVPAISMLRIGDMILTTAKESHAVLVVSMNDGTSIRTISLAKTN